MFVHLSLTPYVNVLINDNPSFADFFLFKQQGAFAEEIDFSNSIIAGLPSVESLDGQLLDRVTENYPEDLKKHIKLLSTPSADDHSTTANSHAKALDALLKAHTDLSNDDLLQYNSLHAYSFSNWTEARKLCRDDIVKENCQTLYNLQIKKLAKVDGEQEDSTDVNYERELLTELFNKTLLQCSDEKRDHVISLKNTELLQKRTLETIKPIAYKVSYVAEAIIHAISFVFNNEIFQGIVKFTVGVIAAAIALVAIIVIIEVGIALATPCIAYIPPAVIAAATWIYDNRFALLIIIGLGSVIANSTFPALNQYVLTPLFDCIWYVTFAPWYMTLLISSAATGARAGAGAVTETVGEAISGLSNAWTDLRLGHEIVEARELWIDQVLADRTAYREALHHNVF